MRFDSVDEAVKALDSPDPDVRKQASGFLADAGSAQSQNALVGALRHARRDVRMFAAESLGRPGNEFAIQPLVVLLHDMGEPNAVRQMAARALGEIGDAASLSVLLELISEAADAADSVDHNLLRAVIKAAGDCSMGRSSGDEKGTRLLETMLETDSVILRQVTVRALGHVGKVYSTGMLVHMLEDSAWLVRQAAADMLGDYGNTACIGALTGYFEDPNRAVRLAAINAVDKLKVRYGE